MKLDVKIGQITLGNVKLNDVSLTDEYKVSELVELLKEGPECIHKLYETYKAVKTAEAANVLFLDNLPHMGGKEENKIKIAKALGINYKSPNGTKVYAKKEFSGDKTSDKVATTKEEGFKFTEEELKRNKYFFFQDVDNGKGAYERLDYKTIEKIYNNDKQFVEEFKYRCLDEDWDFKYICESIIEAVDNIRLKYRGEHVLNHASLIDYTMPTKEEVPNCKVGDFKFSDYILNPTEHKVPIYIDALNKQREFFNTKLIEKVYNQYPDAISSLKCLCAIEEVSYIDVYTNMIGFVNEVKKGGKKSEGSETVGPIVGEVHDDL